jgi:hypothetical protein
VFHGSIRDCANILENGLDVTRTRTFVSRDLAAAQDALANHPDAVPGLGQIIESRIPASQFAAGAPIDSLGRIRVQRHEVRAPADYEARFEELMKAGLPWLNVSCYGVEDGTLIVGIEVPSAQAKPSGRTSVNFSGPTAKVLGSGWRADQVVSIE